MLLKIIPSIFQTLKMTPPIRVHQCFDDNCIIVFADHKINLYCQTFTFVTTLNPIFLPKGHFFEVKDHIFQANWCIGSQFLYPVDGVLQIPILSEKEGIIKPGVSLCHLKIVSVQDVFHKPSSKYKTIHLYSVANPRS